MWQSALVQQPWLLLGRYRYRPGLVDVSRGVQDFDRHEVALRVRVQNDARPSFVALRHRGLAEYHREYVSLFVVAYFHVGLQYFAIRLVR